jgi:mono/diheme cytochrome c family protein
MKLPLPAIAIVALAVAVVASGGAAIVLLGGYDVAATEPHLRATVWVLDTAMRNSVRVRSEHLDVPPLEDVQRIAAGAAVYRQQCETCHGGPGVAPAPFALGMVPAPANLAYTAREWRPRALFWVIKQGIKMTGMPAWEYRLSDDQIWSVVAFLPAMAHMQPVEYAALTGDDTRPSPVAAAALPPDPRRGKSALHQYACATCHVIPGIAATPAPVGPPLAGIARRAFIGGILPNTSSNMQRWLLDPQRIDPRTAMPALGLSERDAADIAAYLATLD